MSATRIIIRILIVLGFVLAGACVGGWLGVSRQAWLITSQQPKFRSLAKLVAGGDLSRSVPNWQEQRQDFYGTIIETVESAEMSRRALERVRALNSELQDKECDVAIRAVQTKGSGIINILATGADPKFTRVFLDALLDEFIGFRQSIRESAQGKVLQRFLTEVVSKQKTMEDSMEKLEKVRSRGADTISTRSDRERLVTRLNAQRNRRDDLRLEIKPMKSDNAERAPLQAQLEAIESEISDIEKQLDHAETALAELNAAREKCEIDKMAYEKLFNEVERLQTLFNTQGDYVSIQERASPASENVEDWVMPSALCALVGGGVSGVAGLMFSLLLVRAPKPPQIPTPVV